MPSNIIFIIGALACHLLLSFRESGDACVQAAVPRSTKKSGGVLMLRAGAQKVKRAPFWAEWERAGPHEVGGLRMRHAASVAHALRKFFDALQVDPKDLHSARVFKESRQALT